ncbi:MAG: phosphoribosylamine--glycine ligase [Planctomycetota bacterium]
MKVLVVGGGGREHALAWKIASSPLVEEVLCAPGNAGTDEAKGLRNMRVAATDLDGLVDLATREEVGLVVVGPEDPLCDGLADRLRERDVLTFGPGADGAKLEGSKLFAKELLDRHRIPTGGWRRFDRAGAAKSYLETLTQWPQVLKANGLAAGKGVFVCQDVKEACAVVDTLMEEKKLGEAGTEILVEEFLIGQEVSVQAVTDGSGLLILEPVVDHKAVGEGDTGPNTGGMGIYSPASFLSSRILRQIEQRVLIPILHALRVEEIDYRGVLYAGLMLTEAGPRVLEFNCRFGDPETQAMVRRLESDLVPYLIAAAEGNLADQDAPDWDPRACVGVVAAAEGYPGSYRKGDPIRGLDGAGAMDGVEVFHAGTRADGGAILTSGGRVLCVTALGADIERAREAAYAGYDAIEWSGKFCRRDIGLPRRPGGGFGPESDLPEDDPVLGVGGSAGLD